MDQLISLYDNALIYYPNVFFSVLFSLSILGIILVSIRIIVLGRKIIRVAKELKRNLKNRKKKTSFIPIIIVFLRREKAFFIQIIIVFLKRKKIFFIHIAKIYLIRVNKLLVRLELQIEKIVKRVGKEILIDK